MSRINGLIGGTRTPDGTATSLAGVHTLQQQEEWRFRGRWANTPQSISDLYIWLDASDANTVYDSVSGGSKTGSGGNVRRWLDKSGAGNNVSNATGPVRTVAGLNGLDVLTFSGQNLTNGLTVSGASAFTLCIVAKADSSGSQVIAAFGNTSSYGAIGTEANLRTAGLYSATVGSNLTSTENYAIGGTVVAAAKSLIVVFGSGVATLYLNGVSVATVSRAAAINAATGFSVGGYFGLGGIFLNGFVGEIAAYSKALSPAEIATINTYFVEKWGIT